MTCGLDVTATHGPAMTSLTIRSEKVILALAVSSKQDSHML
jgi:hypothetical protein